MNCEVLIDYLTFSVKSKDPVGVIREYLGMEPDLFQEMPFSVLPGYGRELRFSDIHVCYEGREHGFRHEPEEKAFTDMGICVSMSGNGCRTFETMSKTDFMQLFGKLAVDSTSNVSRLDVACDDRAGYLTEEEIRRHHYMKRGINSRLRKRRLYDGRDGDDEDGFGLYIGSEKSDFRIRIYDKAQEQGVSGHWMRLEMVFRHENAKAFAEQMTTADSVGKLASEVLNDKVAFIENDDTNITRCSVCDWWTAFVDELESVALVARHAIQHSVERVDAWVSAQVANSLYMIAETMGFSRIYQICMEGKERLNRKQEALIEDFRTMKRASQGLCETVPAIL